MGDCLTADRRAVVGVSIDDRVDVFFLIDSGSTPLGGMLVLLDPKTVFGVADSEILGGGFRETRCIELDVLALTEGSVAAR
jgi:hypothetical protein